MWSPSAASTALTKVKFTPMPLTSMIWSPGIPDLVGQGSWPSRIAVAWAARISQEGSSFACECRWQELDDEGAESYSSIRGRDVVDLVGKFLAQAIVAQKLVAHALDRSFMFVYTGCALLASTSNSDPKTRKQALRDDRAGWTAAERAEIANHTDNGSWELIDRKDVPPGRGLVRLIWVYKRKRNGALRARLCVQGCAQIPGVDYEQTFCATMRATSLRTLASLAAQRGLAMRRWDFVAAYLQGELEPGEVVYCRPPPGYETIGPDGKTRVCRVVKPIYGMAQAGRRWQRSLFPWLLSWGSTQSYSDPCVFTCERQIKGVSQSLIIGCYVDDLFVLYPDDGLDSLYTWFTTALSSHWNVEDEGPVSDLLNVDIATDADCILLKQEKYIARLVDTYLPEGIPSSFHKNHAPAADDLPLRVEEAIRAKETGVAPDPAIRATYQSLVGALLYCSTQTRPDIAYAVGMLCRAMSCPTIDMLNAAKRVLFYLSHHRAVGLRYARAESTPLTGFSDSDWASRRCR
eukprot:408618-Pleurochrysis_carterae.AAC.1